MMRKFLQNWGLLSLICVLSCLAGKAQADTSDDYGTLLWHTDFTDAMALDMKTAYGDMRSFEMENGDYISMEFYGVGLYPEGTNDKFPEYTGYMETAKYTGEFDPEALEMPDTEPYAVTGTFSSIKTIVFKQLATGTKRGLKISVKGDGDSDWVALWEKNIDDSENCQNTSNGGREATDVLEVNRTNCQIKFEATTPSSANAYLKEISVYGEASSDDGSGYTFTFDPEDGAKVTSVSQITINASGTIMANWDDFEEKDVKVYYVGSDQARDEEEPVAYGKDFDYDDEDNPTAITIYLNNTITSAGLYRCDVPEGFLYCGSATNMSEALSTFFTIQSDIDNGDTSLTLDPADGSIVESLSTITVSGKVAVNWSEYSESDIKVYNAMGDEVATVETDGIEDVYGDSWDYNDAEIITLTPTITDAGTYTLKIPAGFFYVGENQAASAAIEATYTILGSSNEDTSVEFIPENNSTVSSIYEIDIASAQDENGYYSTPFIWLLSDEGSDEALQQITVKNASGKDVTYVSEVEFIYSTDGEGTQVGVELKLHQEIVSAGRYTYTIPANSYAVGGVTEGNEQQIIAFVVDGSEEDTHLTLDPPSGETVGSLSTITVSGLLSVNNNFSASDIVVYDNDNNPVAYGADIEDIYDEDNWTYNNAEIITLDTTIKDAGDYTLVIPEDFFFIGAAQNQTSGEILAFYTVTGEGDASDITYVPAEGDTVETLSEISITCEDGLGWLLDDDDLSEIVVKNTVTNETVTTVVDYESIQSDNDDEDLTLGVRLFLETPITVAGKYNYTIPAGAFVWGESDRQAKQGQNTLSMTYNEETTVYFSVSGVGSGSNLTFDPESGSNVTSLSQITVGCEDGIDCSWNYTTEVTVTNDKGVVVANSTDCEVNYPEDDPWGAATSCTILLDSEITDAGTYTVTIPEGYFVIGSDYANSEELTLTYIISGGESGYEFTFVPDDGETVEGDVDEIQILVKNAYMTINAWEEAIWDPIEIKDENGNVAATFSLEEWFGAYPIQDDDWNTIGYECYLSQTISDPGTYTYTIPANAFWVGPDWAAMDDYSPEMTVQFTIANSEPTVYEFTFSPADGEYVEGPVSELTVTVDNAMIANWDEFLETDIVVTNAETGEVVTGVEEWGFDEIFEYSEEGYPTLVGYTFTLADEISEPGTYTYTYPEHAFLLGPDEADMSDEMTITFTITESDGIKSAIKDATGDDRYYNLNGQRVTTPRKGIYILNGKKVVVK